MKKKNIGLFIIFSAAIWGIAMLLCSFQLSGSPNKDEIMYILSGAAGMHLILIWGPIGAMFSKMKKEEEKIAE